MNDKQQELAGLLTLLRRIASKWPKSGEDVDASHSSLKEYLADDFSRIDLYHGVNSIGAIQETDIEGKNATIYFHDADDVLQRAVFRKVQASEWKLVSLKFQCPICFGTGENEGDDCAMCGGIGWGVS